MKKKSLYKMLKVEVEWICYITLYGFVLIAISVLFPKTIYIDNAYFGLWGFMASSIIFLLNKTIKPFIVWLTIPITALTLGLFYPFINVFILHIVHFILKDHFTIHGIWMSFIVAVCISAMNHLMDHFVLKPLLTKEEKYE